MKTMMMALLAATAMTFAAPATAATLFDGGAPNSTTFRSADSGPGQSIAVTNATTLTNIGVYAASPLGGNIKYLIFDAAGTNLLFSITSAAVNLSATPSLIESPTFSFGLAAGSSYQFGIISDSNLNVGYDAPPSQVSQNGLTSFGNNHNYSSFATPVSAGDGGASIPIVLFGDQGAVQGTVPEPATWATMLLGFGLIGFAMRKRSNPRRSVGYS